jgi:hypothetical protein
MEEKVLKQMIAAVDEVVKYNKSDFYKYDLHTLNDYDTSEFVWGVYEYGTALLVIDIDKAKYALDNGEASRFTFMNDPNCFFIRFSYSSFEKLFHYKDGIMNEITIETVRNIYESFTAELLKYVSDKYGGSEGKYWGKKIPIHFTSHEAFKFFLEMVHEEAGENLLECARVFRGYQRIAINHAIYISIDSFCDKGFYFEVEVNGCQKLNGGILFYDGKWHRHT